jgi:hypothetical protein
MSRGSSALEGAAGSGGAGHLGRHAMPSVSGCLVLPTCGVIPLFHRRFRVSYLIQLPKAMRLKVNKCRAPQAPKAPRRPCGTSAYKTPARPHLSWGLCFCSSGRLRPTFAIDDDVFGDALPRPAFDRPASPPIRVPATDLTAFAPKRHRNNDSDRL